MSNGSGEDNLIHAVGGYPTDRVDDHDPRRLSLCGREVPLTRTAYTEDKITCKRCLELHAQVSEMLLATPGPF